MSDAVQMLEEQHAQVTALFMKLERLSDATICAHVFRTLDSRLREHATLEEQIFYPAFRERQRRRHINDGEVSEALHEHNEIKSALKQLEAAKPATSLFASKLSELKRVVQHHVHEEESTILPQARKLFSESELDDLAFRMHKLQSLYSPAYEIGGSAATT